MAPAPLIVMFRRVGTDAWRIHLSEPGRFTLLEPSQLSVEVLHEVGARAVQLTIRSARLDASGSGRKSEDIPGGEVWDVVLGQPVVLRNDLGSVELVCFRAADTTPVSKPGPRLLKAIEAMRGQDTPDSRHVLSDVLEESGALKEAAYVRLEQELQSSPRGPSMELGRGFEERLVQFRALGAVVGTTFRYLVGRDVEGCVGMRWTFRCPRSWNEMEFTDDETVRACAPCRQLVTRAETEEEVRALAAKGVCVSLRVFEEFDEVEGEIAAEPEPELDPLDENVAIEPEPEPE